MCCWNSYSFYRLIYKVGSRVVDEEPRFGVDQHRGSSRDYVLTVHFLSMSGTPIPVSQYGLSSSRVSSEFYTL